MPKPEEVAPEESSLSPQAETLIKFAIENPDQFQLISDVVATRSRDKLNHRRTQEYEDSLRDLFESLTSTASFTVGDLVTWKPLLKNRVRPAYGEPAIVIEFLDKPVRNSEANPSSTYFREPLDLVLGLLDDDGEILVYHFDSRRFEQAARVD